MLRPSDLPDNFVKDAVDGLSYSVHEDGSLSRVCHLRAATVTGWDITLSQGRAWARRVMVDETAFPEVDAGQRSGDESALRDWLAEFVQEMVAEQAGTPEIRCSFCERKATQVRKMLAASDCAICDSCVGRCLDVLRSEGIEP